MDLTNPQDRAPYINTSASQRSAWELCEARLGFGTFLKLPQSQSPEATYGEKVTHKQQEDYFNQGILPVHPANLLTLDWPILAAPKTPGIEIEQWLSGFSVAGLNVRGRVDYRDLRNRKVPLILDWKSKGRKAQLKSEYELESDPQLNIYAAELLNSIPEAEAVIVGHGYIARSETNPWAQLVVTEPMPREAVQARIAEMVPSFERMKVAATLPEDQWARNKKSCFAFGRRCDFYDRCHGIKSMTGIDDVVFDATPGEPAMPDQTAVSTASSATPTLAEKLAAMKERRGAVGITPPDAPRYDVEKIKAENLARVASAGTSVEATSTSSTTTPTPCETTSTAFYIIWNPSATRPPTTRFKTLKEAQDVAEKMMTKSPGEKFFVCMALT